VISGVALSVEVEELKLKIHGVCDARHLARRRPGGEHGGTESVLLCFESESESLTKQSHARISVIMLELLCRIYCSVSGATFMVMSQQYVGGRFQDVGRTWDRGLCSFHV
jgi:hypothetical protein